ncbi:hypothetical protein LSAT2_022963 [Lamellibrachia satsuma]|nr:hypothetical protein LSAT2_022963 [Lamellibrachia satsuma]
MSSLRQADKSGDEKDDSSEIKLPPLVKSDSVKSSGKSASSKSSTGSFYLKSPKYTIWGRSNVESVLTDYGYSPNEMLQSPGKHERQNTAKKSFSFDDSDVLKERETRQSRKKYYLKIYEDIHKLRDYCRDEYFEKLEEKVEKQRKNMQKKKRGVTFMDSSEDTPVIPEEGTVSKMTSPFLLPSMAIDEQKPKKSVYEDCSSSMRLMENWLAEAEAKAMAKEVADEANKTAQTTKQRQQHKRYYVSKIFRKPKRDVFLARNYLKNIPKSEHYKIIELEEKLRSEGKLRTQADIDEFWCTVRKPDVFRKYFLVTEQRTLSHTSAPQVPISMVATLSNPMQQAMLAEPPPVFKPLDNILEYWQSPKVVNIRDKAGHMTSLGRRSKSPIQPVPVKKEDDPFHRARKAAAELDRRHPQMGIPPLNCFSMDLDEKPRDPEEHMRVLQGTKHSKERLLFAKRLHRMYSLANSNHATTQRILEKREDLEHVPFQAGCSIVSDLISEQVLLAPTLPSFEEPRPWMKYIERKREIDPIEEVSEGGSADRHSHTSAKSEKSEKFGPHTMIGAEVDMPFKRSSEHLVPLPVQHVPVQVYHMPPRVCASISTGKLYRSSSGECSARVHVQDTVPICWESLVEDEDVKVLESKTPSFYWFNYMRAGQKVTP